MLNTTAKNRHILGDLRFPSDIKGFRFDFFTQINRINHCGHAIITRSSYLAEHEYFIDGVKLNEKVDEL